MLTTGVAVPGDRKAGTVAKFFRELFTAFRRVVKRRVMPFDEDTGENMPGALRVLGAEQVGGICAIPTFAPGPMMVAEVKRLSAAFLIRGVAGCPREWRMEEMLMDVELRPPAPRNQLKAAA